MAHAVEISTKRFFAPVFVTTKFPKQGKFPEICNMAYSFIKSKGSSTPSASMAYNTRRNILEEWDLLCLINEIYWHGNIFLQTKLGRSRKYKIESNSFILYIRKIDFYFKITLQS